MNPDEESATQLCKSCGICCLGLLHSHGVLKPEEVDTVAALGLETLTADGPAFALPCRKFAGCCTIYQSRPRACRGFRCALLRRLDDNDVSLGDALEIVGEAQRLITAAMPDATPAELASEFRKQRRIGGVTQGKPEQLGFIALGLYLDKHFVLPKDGNFYSMQHVTGGSS